MAITVKEMKRQLEELSDDTVLCVGEDGEYMSIESLEEIDDYYMDFKGEEKEARILILKNE